MTDIPSLAFNLKKNNNEYIPVNYYKKQKNQSQVKLSIELLAIELKDFSNKLNLDTNLYKIANEMERLPTLKVMNMKYLAGALVFLNSVDEPTPENFKTEYKDNILKVIYNISLETTSDFNVSQYEQLFNYIFCVYLYRNSG
jgi:hypothetical protein